jgi:type I restriction enzyme S subunit
MNSRSFSVPEEVSLLDLVDVVGGGTPSRSEPRYWGGDIPWATVKDLSDAAIRDTSERITQEGLENSAANLVPAGAIVLATRIAPGRATLTRFDLAINQDLKGLIPRAGVDAQYLLYFIHSNALRIARMGAGSTVSGITLESLRRVRLLLPTLAEQRRIAGMLGKADAMQRKQKERMRLLDALVQSAFLEMFGDPVKNEKGWRQLTLGELLPERALIVDGPFGSSLKPDSYVGSGIRVIRNFNIEDDSFDGSAFKYITADKFEQVKRSEVEAGDVLISTKGTLGNVCLMPLLPGQSVLSASGTVRVRLPDGLPLRRQFMVSQMITPSYKQYLKGFEAGTNQKYMNLSGIRSLAVILPPVELQDRFNRVRETVAAAKERRVAALRASNALSESLARESFGGRSHGS